MRVTRITLAIVTAASALCASAFRAQETRSIWDGVYTEAQAKRGEAIYFERCVRCHGPALMGGTDGAGPLTGPTFKAIGLVINDWQLSGIWTASTGGVVPPTAPGAAKSTAGALKV